MAGQKIDVTDYLKWEKIVTPQGQVLYLVPGSPWAYDPFLSQTQGHNIFFKNPKPQLDQQRQADKDASNARKQGSPGAQAANIGYATAGTLGALYATKYAPGLGKDPQFVFDKNNNLIKINPDGTYSVANGPTITPGTSGAAPSVTSPAGQEFVSAAVNQYTPNGGAAPGGGASVPTTVDGQYQTNIDWSTESPGTVQTTQNPGANQAAGTDYGAVAGRTLQGVGGAVQAYQGYKQYQNGDKVGGSLGMAAGGTNVAAAAGSSTAGSVAPYLNAALSAYGAYKTYKNPNISDKQRNFALQQQAGLAVADFYTAGAASALVGLARANPTTAKALGRIESIHAHTDPVLWAANKFVSSKSSEQVFRDKMRKYWIENGVLNPDYTGTLADGSTFDFGKDGKGLAKIDYKDPTTGQVVGLSNLLAVGEGLTGGATTPVAELYTGAALSNSQGNYEIARQNIQHFAQQRGLDQKTLLDRLQAFKDEGKIDDSQYAAYINATNELYRKGKAPATVVAAAPTPVDRAPTGATPGTSNVGASNRQIVPDDTEQAQIVGRQLADRFNSRYKV